MVELEATELTSVCGSPCDHPTSPSNSVHLDDLASSDLNMSAALSECSHSNKSSTCDVEDMICHLEELVNGRTSKVCGVARLPMKSLDSLDSMVSLDMDDSDEAVGEEGGGADWVLDDISLSIVDQSDEYGEMVTDNP